MKKVIGIIDDNRKDIELLKGNLVNAQFDVFEIDTTKDVLEQIRNHPPHIILTELFCNNSDMIDIIIKYKSSEIYKEIPVLIYTSEKNIESLIDLDEKIFIRAIPKNKRWGGVLNEINAILRKNDTRLLVKKMDTLLVEAKGKVFEMGSVIGLGETSFMFACDLSFRPNIILNVNNPILDDIKYDACVLKTIRSQPLLNARYKYKTKCSLPGLSEGSLQNLRQWMYKNCQRRV